MTKPPEQPPHPMDIKFPSMPVALPKRKLTVWILLVAVAVVVGVAVVLGPHH